MNDSGSIRRSIVWLNFERGVRVLAAVLQVALVARYLGANLYGELSTAIAIAAMAIGPASLGLDAVLVRKLVISPLAAGSILSTAILLRLIAGTLALLGIIIAATCNLSSPLDRLVIIVSLSCIAQCPGVLETWFRSRVSAATPAVGQIAGTFFGLVYRSTVIIFELNIEWLAAANTVEALITTCILYISYRQSSAPPLMKASLSDARQLLGECWPLALASLGAVLLSRIDIVTLHNFSGQRATGFYSAALRIVELTALFPISLITSTTPILLKVHSNSKQQFDKLFAKYAAVFFWIGIAMAVFISAFGPLLARQVYGSQFDESGNLLRILAWNLVPGSVAIAWGVYWLAEQRQLTMTVLSFIGAGVIYALCIHLIPRFGSRGAAIAIIIGQLAPFAILLVTSRTRAILLDTAAAITNPRKLITFSFNLVSAR